jgi:predicted ATPase/DNA-binding CsgD family transcriptional regulator
LQGLLLWRHALLHAHPDLTVGKHLARLAGHTIRRRTQYVTPASLKRVRADRLLVPSDHGARFSSRATGFAEDGEIRVSSSPMPGRRIDEVGSPEDRATRILPEQGCHDAVRERGEGAITPLRRRDRTMRVEGESAPGPLHRRPRRECHNLPAPITSFVGRDREIGRLTELLSSTRLLTLTGVGGVGKTRLALELAATLVGAYPDGVRLADLAQIADPSLVPQALARAVGIREQPGHSLHETLATSLRPRRVLLVVDNCEHLTAACADIVERVLVACPAVQVVATSREVLGTPGELVWPVPPLSVPGPTSRSTGAGTRPANAGESEAVRLFAERARSVRSTFALSERNVGVVAEICRRLEGIPLAIELAATRVGLLNPEQIAARLDDRFRLLTDGRRTVPRHRTLRAAVDWSYDLLSEPERVLLRRLSVFTGGWLLEAAEAVCAGEARDEGRATRNDRGDQPLALRPSILDTLGQLVNKSLVLVEEEESIGERRYRLLETIRQYATEKLREAGEEEEVRRWHRDWYLELAELAGPHTWGPDQGIWSKRLAIDFENIRAAIIWSRDEPGGIEAALRIAGALRRFWDTRGYYTDTWLLLSGLLSQPSELSMAKIDTMIAASGAAFYRGDQVAVRALPEEWLPLARQLGHVPGIVVHSVGLGLIALHDGDVDRAAPLFEQGLKLARDGDDRTALYTALLWAGNAAFARGEHDRAIDLVNESLALAQEQGDHWHAALTLDRLAHVAFLQCDYSRAIALQKDSLRLRHDVDDRHGVSLALEELSWSAVAQRQWQRAATLLGAAEAVRDEIGAVLLPPWQLQHDPAVSAARGALGDVAFAAAWSAGRSLPSDAAVDYALAADEPPPRRHRAPDESSSAANPDDLSPREREVAGLIARGHTNAQIAAALVIAEGTAANHVQHILGKLGFHSRAQVAAWAVAHAIVPNSGGDVYRQ